MDASYLAFGVLLFVAVVLALEGLYHLWAAQHSASAKRIAARLRALDGTPSEALSLDRLQAAQQHDWLQSELFVRYALVQRIQAHVRTSGTGRSAGELLMASGLLAVAGAALALLRGWGGMAPLLAAMAAALPWLWLTRQRNMHLQRMEHQLPLALDLMSRALRAGHTLPAAIKMVCDEMPDPMAREFRQVSDETNFGMAQSEALARLARRVPLEDMRFFAVAVMVQREAGGNLAELLDNLAAIVRSRMKLMGQVRTFSAEGRASAWVLGLLPFGVGGLMSMTNPDFMSELWRNPTGLKLMGGALGLMVLGGLWMRRIVRVRV